MVKRTLKTLRIYVITMYTKFGTGVVYKKAKSFDDLILNRMSKKEKANWFSIEDHHSHEELTHLEWLERIGIEGEELEALSR